MFQRAGAAQMASGRSCGTLLNTKTGDVSEGVICMPGQRDSIPELCFTGAGLVKTDEGY